MQTVRTSLEAKLAALHNCPYFSGLDEGTLERLSAGMRLVHFERDEAVFWQEEVCAGLHIIQRGSVKLFKLSPQGREFIVNVFKEGATFNEAPVFDGGTNPINVVTLEESELWIINPEDIRMVLSDHPEMYQAVVLNLSQNLRMLVSVVEEVSFYQVTNRLARLLSQLNDEQMGAEATQRITQDQLAARLGTVREVVARSLRELERCGAIHLSQRRIYVDDEVMLHKWAQRPG